MNCTSVTPLSTDVCRLCTKIHEYYVNIFISNESCEIMVEEAIQDLLGLPVAVGDGLPNVVCRLCLRKLIEFREFKNMCFASASELRAYAMGNDFLVSKIKNEDAADVETSRDGSSRENTFLNNIQVTEVYITTPDDLAIGSVSHSKEELWTSENALVVKEEVNDGENGIEGDVSVDALTSVAVDPLAVDTMSHAKEEFISSENVLVVKEEVNDGEHGIEGDLSVDALASVAVDPLAADTMVDRCYNIGGLKMEPEEESDKIGADRQWISQKKVHINPSCDPVREENLQPEHSMAKSFVDNCFPMERVKNQKKNVTFYASNEIFSQLNDRSRPVGNYEREQLCHQDENTSYPTEYICNYCGTRYLEKNSLALHIKRHMDEMRSAIVLPETDFPPRFSQRLLVKDRGHVEPVILETGNVSFTQITCGSVKALKCNECGKMFSKKSRLNRHSVVHTGVKPFKCNECGKMFSQRSHVNRHSVTHTGMKPFMCYKCGKMFSTKSDLKIHSVVHTGEKPFKCMECGKMFATSGNLNQHSVVHSGVKQFKCKECGKMFTRKCTLNKHSVVHTGVKEFQCNECGMMFTGKDELNMHSGIHNGAKRFKCNECGKSFTRKDTLNLHLRVHSGVKAFKCRESGKMFTQRSHLRSHSRIHSGVKLYKCDVCSKQFKWKSAFNSHLLAHADQNRSK